MQTFTNVGLDALLTPENCAGELQRDWARTERLGAVAQILFDHAGASGTVLAWELANEAQRA